MLKQSAISFFLLVPALHAVTISFAQDTAIATPGNSCQPYFDKNKNPVHYVYNVAKQTHDYSGNWDFDGDGKTDGLFFVGTGGAHLYFYLSIVLSADKKTRNFPFLELDMPCLGNIDELKQSQFYPPPLFPQFVVDKFSTGALSDNANDKIYLHLDRSAVIPPEWKKRGVSSTYLLLYYKKGSITIQNFIE
ncbi:hypothetical protein [Ferruginibacter profundus]